MGNQNRFDFDPAVLPAVAYAAGMTTIGVKHAELCDNIHNLSGLVFALILGLEDGDVENIDAADLSKVSREALEKALKHFVKTTTGLTQALIDDGIRLHTMQFKVTDALFPEIAHIEDYRIEKNFDPDVTPPTVELFIKLKDE